MLRVRDTLQRGSDASKPSVMPESATLSPRSRRVRMAAMALGGIALGAGGTVLTVSLVQAGDDAGAREVYIQEQANRRAQRTPGPAAGYASAGPMGYAPPAPARGGLFQQFFRPAPGMPVAQPIALNPFKTQRGDASRPTTRTAARPASKGVQSARLDTVSGAADVARTICVRLCDGFQAPIGFLRANADMKAHDALCQAMNPGIPVKVFKVAAGADTIENAQAADGTRYGRLPVAYSHQSSAEPTCRPAIVREGERRISLLRDITLRPGDSVVLDGKVRTFSGSSRWPYSTADFRDFRSSAELSKSQRHEIDRRVGISRLEEDGRILRRRMLLSRQQASLQDKASDADVFVLRGPLDPKAKGPVRVISLTPER